LKRVASRLRELVGDGHGSAELARAPGEDSSAIEYVVSVDGLRFAVQWRSSGKVAAVSGAIESLKARLREPDAGGEAVPLVAVPFMGRSGRERCRRAGVCWLDLSGNAEITSSGLRISILGRPNGFKAPGRPANVFAPKSSRIARLLLIHPEARFSQREISKRTGIGEGYTSKIVRRLEEDGLVQRETRGRLTPRDADLLLDAWLEAYDFGRHDILRGHVAARSGMELTSNVFGALNRAGLDCAVTGLSAAWLIDGFAAFRTATVFVPEIPKESSLEGMGFDRGDRGANTLLVSPNDSGVFMGSCVREGIRCVHPVQALLDLQFANERAREAARHLRADHMPWETHDPETR